MKKTYLSKDGFERLAEELRDLKTRGRRDVARMIDEARSHGDLSENAEYEAAKEAQAMLEKRISELENSLSNARVLDDKNLDNSQVYILSTVTALNKKTGKHVTYTLVAAEEADFHQNKISIDSPIGAALMGKKVGDRVSVKVPAGTIEFEIIELNR